MEKSLHQKNNPLATEKVGKLIMTFAIPAIISNLVNALYNIVDQIFIGQGVGLLGNAATNVAFPLTTISTAIALLIGVGAASNFNLKLGANDKEKAGFIAGNAITLMIVFGTLLAVVVIMFLEPLMFAFGATDQVLDYAMTYTGITSFGLPFLIFSTGCSNLIRSDGSPLYSMLCILSGAILNTILDPLFIFGFGMGIEGAALATVIGQIVSAICCLFYLKRFKNIQLTKAHFKIKKIYINAIAALGAAACFNQLAMTLVQITMNNTLRYYGGLSIYGSEIPLACVGVITKVNIVFMAFSLGISQGSQPIIGFNYGAQNYERVKETYKKAGTVITCIAIVAFLCFQFFPREIVSIFGQGSEAYFTFAERYFKIFMMMTFINGIQPLTSNFFTSIGKAKIGIVMSLTRQILFLLPLVIIFPMIFGIDGVMYAGPIADSAAAIIAIVFIVREFRKMTILSKAQRAI